MTTSDKTAPSEAGHSSYIDAPETPERCTVLTKDGEPCQFHAVKNGRCFHHLVDEIVPADELEALRQLQEAAAQHAIDAHFSNPDHLRDDKDQEFNRNARTAVQLSRLRHSISPKAKDSDTPKSDVVFGMMDNGRGDAEKDEGSAAKPDKPDEGEDR